MFFQFSSYLIRWLDVRQQTAEFGRGGSTVYLSHHHRHVGFIQGIDECRKGNHGSLSQKQSLIQSQKLILKLDQAVLKESYISYNMYIKNKNGFTLYKSWKERKKSHLIIFISHHIVGVVPHKMVTLYLQKKRIRLWPDLFKLWENCTYPSSLALLIRDTLYII